MESCENIRWVLGQLDCYFKSQIHWLTQYMAALGKNLKYKIFIKNLSLCVNCFWVQEGAQSGGQASAKARSGPSCEKRLPLSRPAWSDRSPSGPGLSDKGLWKIWGSRSGQWGHLVISNSRKPLPPLRLVERSRAGGWGHCYQRPRAGSVWRLPEASGTMEGRPLCGELEPTGRRRPPWRFQPHQREEGQEILWLLPPFHPST